MRHEYEAKFLYVDVEAIREKLTALGAVQAFPRTLLTRKIFDHHTLSCGQWLRLRNEGSGSTLTLKQVTDAAAIDGTTEIETHVSDFHATAEILRRLGLREVRYQENYREEWRLGDVLFDIDTWPDLPTFLEIEGPDEASVRRATTLLALDYTQARFGSVDEIYKSEAGRDILAEPTLLFPDGHESAGLPSSVAHPPLRPAPHQGGQSAGPAAAKAGPAQANMTPARSERTACERVVGRRRGTPGQPAVPRPTHQRLPAQPAPARSRHVAPKVR